MSGGTDQRHKWQRNPPYPALGAVSSQGRAGGCASVPLARDAPGEPFPDPRSETSPVPPERLRCRWLCWPGTSTHVCPAAEPPLACGPRPALAASRQPPAATCCHLLPPAGGDRPERRRGSGWNALQPPPRGTAAPRAPQPGSFRENYSRGLVLWHKGVFSACWRERTLCPLPACF